MRHHSDLAVWDSVREKVEIKFSEYGSFCPVEI